MKVMMYRGKEIASGEWFHGYCVKCYDNNRQRHETVIFEPDVNFYSHGETDGWYIVDENTVGMDTGLFDKNGMSIYDGDILESRASSNRSDWKRWLVRYSDGGFTIECSPVKHGRRRYAAETLLLCVDEIVLLGLEIIGNIHDNGDLIGGCN